MIFLPPNLWPTKLLGWLQSVKRLTNLAWAGDRQQDLPTGWAHNHVALTWTCSSRGLTRAVGLKGVCRWMLFFSLLRYSTARVSLLPNVNVNSTNNTAECGKAILSLGWNYKAIKGILHLAVQTTYMILNCSTNSPLLNILPTKLREIPFKSPFCSSNKPGLWCGKYH